MKLEPQLIGLIGIALIAGIAIGFVGAIVINPLGTPTVDIRYGGQYYPGEFFLKGYPEIWTKYDLAIDHRLFSSGGEGNEALVAGNVDINVGADSKTIALFNAIPEEALIIGTVQRGNRYSTVVKTDSSYNSWDDLVGKTVGTRYGTGAEATLRKFFASNKTTLTWDDFNWQDVKVEDMSSALNAGQIEAFTAWEPTPAIAEAQGVGRVIRSYGDIALVPVSIHTTKSFAYSHPAKVVAFLAAQLEKMETINDDPTTAADYAAQAASQFGIEVSADAFLNVYNRIDFSIDFNQSIIDDINNTAYFLYDEGSIDKIPTLRWDRSFIESAIKLREAMSSGSSLNLLLSWQKSMLDISLIPIIFSKIVKIST
ncbi:MAG: ABC transporter substrate-binding protein [Promethearchaeota archaeon]